MSELKPCPFCGSEAGTYKFILPGEIVWLAYCPNENCHFSHRTASLAAWNARPIEDALNERIAELETERDQAKNELADIRKMVTVSKNYSELWEEREWLSNKLTYAERCIDEGNARIAKIIAERDEVRAIVEKLIKVGNKLGKFTLILDSLSANGFVDDWIALVDEWKESEK